MILRLQTESEILRVNPDPNSTLTEIFTKEFGSNEFIASNTKDFIEKLPQDQKIKEFLQEGDMIHVQIINLNKSEKIKPDIKTNKPVANKKSKCRTHPPGAMCPECAPEDPWSASLLASKEINYVSHGAFIKKHRIEKIPSLDYIRICRTHPANQVCTNCQKKTITLVPQEFRTVDHIELYCSNEIQEFVAEFKRRKKYGIGILIGKYGEYERVPLGQKVMVKGVVEMGEAFPDGFKLDQNFKDQLKPFLVGHEIVGMIYLAPPESNFIPSPIEISFIAKMQNEFPWNGSSRFVTLRFREELEEWQVSCQAMALFMAGIAKITVENQFYDKHNRIVHNTTEGIKEGIATEFLLVRLTHGAVTDSQCKFIPKAAPLRFIGEIIEALNDAEKQAIKWNFSFLIRLNDLMDITELIRTIETNNAAHFKAFKDTDQYKRILERIKVLRGEWVCKVCTYINLGGLECQMCNTAQ